MEANDAQRLHDSVQAVVDAVSKEQDWTKRMATFLADPAVAELMQLAGIEMSINGDELLEGERNRTREVSAMTGMLWVRATKLLHGTIEQTVQAEAMFLLARSMNHVRHVGNGPEYMSTSFQEEALTEALEMPSTAQMYEKWVEHPATAGFLQEVGADEHVIKGHERKDPQATSLGDSVDADTRKQLLALTGATEETELGYSAKAALKLENGLRLHQSSFEGPKRAMARLLISQLNTIAKHEPIVFEGVEQDLQTLTAEDEVPLFMMLLERLLERDSFVKLLKQADVEVKFEGGGGHEVVSINGGFATNLLAVKINLMDLCLKEEDEERLALLKQIRACVLRLMVWDWDGVS